MPKTLEFLFDFASPNAYLVHRVLPALARRTGAEVTYVPCLLGGIFKATGNQAPMLAFGNIKGKLAYDRLEFMRFVQRHGLTDFTMNPHFPVNTLLMMRGAVAAGMDGQLAPYVEAGMRAMWEQGRNMAEPEVFAETFSKAGLDGPALLARSQDPEVKAQLMQNTEAAVARGAFGLPTFFIGDEMFFGKERLWQIEEELGS